MNFNIKIKISIIAVLFGLLLQSCVSNTIPNGVIIYDRPNGCFYKSKGVLKSIDCTSSILSKDQRLDSLIRFEQFLNSPDFEVALAMSKQRVRDQSEEYFGGSYDYIYHNPLEMMSGNKFIIRLSFRNYSLFPEKYSHSDTVKSDSSEEFKNMWTHKILKRYLGEDYENYQPKLGFIDGEKIDIRLLVSNVDELESIIYRDPIYSVRHAGDAPIYYEVYP